MEKNVVRVCKKHGETKFVSTSKVRMHYRCMRCSTEAVQRRREKLKLLAVEYKGGKCQRCGYCKCLKALEFHHIDPEQKEFGIGHKGETRSWEKTKVELDKCILVCANCHREIHAELMLEE
jgi:DNA-directed RNA polymerase subunit RPC12/RpoP